MKKKLRYKKKAQEGLNNLLSGETTDSILRSQESMQQKQDTKRGIENSVNSFSSQFASPLGSKIGQFGNMGGEALSQNSFKKDGTVKKGQYAAGKAVKYGSTGAQIGSNPALMAATGGASVAIGAALGTAAGVASGLVESKNINYQAKEINKQKKTLGAQNNIQATVNDRIQANQAKNGKYKIKVPVDEMVEEHEELLKTLKSPSKSDDKKEYKKQSKELKKYKKLDKKEDIAEGEEREIETEGREPIFSDKDANGNRKLLYYNPNDPTHSEGGVKAKVVKKGKYKMKSGESKLTIPEGSAIVTAKNNDNKKALMAYKRGDKQTLEKIINKMPVDKPSKKKKDDGNLYTKLLNYGKEIPKEVDLQTSAVNIIDGKEVPQTNPNSPLAMAKRASEQAKKVGGQMGSKIGSDVSTNKFDLNQGLNKALTSAPAIYNTGKGLFGRVQKTERNYYNPELLKYKDASDPLRKAAQDEYTQTREEVRRGAPNASTYLANSQMAANQRYKRREGIENNEVQRQTDINNQNVGLKNEAKMANLELRNQYNDMDLQNKSRKDDYLAKGLEQGSSLAQMSTLNKNREKSDEALLKVLKSKNFKFNRDSNEVTTYNKGSKNLKPKYKKKK